MIFKLFWSLLKNIRWLLTFTVTILIGYLVFTQYKTIKASPIGAFLPNTALDSFDINQLPRWQDLSGQKTPSSSVMPTPLPETIKVEVATSTGKVLYTLETALTPDSRALGLMYRQSMPTYNGMFFAFEYPIQYGFWMKNCEFPLDMIFLNESYEIVDIIKEAPPCKTIDATQEKCPSYIPKSAYRYVIELNAGSTTQNGIERGQHITIL